MSKSRILMLLCRELEKMLATVEGRKPEWKQNQAHMIRKAARMEGLTIQEMRKRLAEDLRDYRRYCDPKARNKHFKHEFEMSMKIAGMNLTIH